jgi:hypothetical protein
VLESRSDARREAGVALKLCVLFLLLLIFCYHWSDDRCREAVVALKLCTFALTERIWILERRLNCTVVDYFHLFLFLMCYLKRHFFTLSYWFQWVVFRFPNSLSLIGTAYPKP